MRSRKHPLWWALMVCCSLSMGACSVMPKGRADLDVGTKQRGIASWYGEDFHGWMTANGEIYDMYALTGAHRTLPLGTLVRVTNVVNGKQVHIRINDRGPYVKGRILDLSYRAAEELNMLRDGVSAVYLEVVGYGGMPAFSAYDYAFGSTDPLTVESASAAIRQRYPELSQFLPVVSSSHRVPRQTPVDILRERRARRVGDILAANQRADVVSVLSLAEAVSEPSCG